ncbi:MAG: hypothetical protein FWD14_05745 [Treponema sp.]|nr:hypothetical protein [Treponema sp.]
MPTSEFYKNAIGAKVLFVTGILMMLSLLFNPGTEYRVIQFLYFLFLALLSGRKINILFTFLITLFIIIFNLIIPYGNVLFSIGSFKITSGALEAGIHRAVTLQALVILSRVTIRQDLKLPGKFGRLLGESMQIFSFLTGKKYKITGKNFFAEVDNLMLTLSDGVNSQLQVQEIKTKSIGFIILTFIVILSWLPFILALQN